MSKSRHSHKISIIIKIIAIGLLCAVLAGNLYLIAVQLSDKNNLPKIFGFARIIVISGSMQPAIEAGDLIIIKEQAEYREDDIVTYRRGGALITHRIIEADKSEVITKGDANNVNDDPVALADIEGKVVLCIPGAGNFILFLKTPAGILAVSFLVLVLFALSRVAQMVKREKKKV